MGFRRTARTASTDLRGSTLTGAQRSSAAAGTTSWCFEGVIVDLVTGVTRPPLVGSTSAPPVLVSRPGPTACRTALSSTQNSTTTKDKNLLAGNHL
jgi:hypothetical protein